MHSIFALVLSCLCYAHGLKSFRENDVLRYDSTAINGASRVSEEWIKQPLDHFSESKKSWNMRYFKRLDLWKPNGPIIIYINGEWTADSRSIQGDNFLAVQLAKDTNGALFSSEHRFYGKSLPVSVYPVTTPGLKFLSAKQALADLGELIKFIKSAPEFKSSKVVVLGGSYAGNLAAWMKVLHPDLVDAAVSSSGPVLAKKDFYEYLETVNDVYEKYGSSDCLDRIRRKFNHYEDLLKSSEGIEQLKIEMNICKDTDMHVSENQQLFFAHNFGVFQGKVQHGNPDVIKQHCDELKEDNWIRSDLDYKDISGCIRYDFEAYVEAMKPFMWLYQSCTEFGYFQTTTSDKQPFGDKTRATVDFYAKLCQGLYGDEFNEKRVDDGIAITNSIYGGLTPNVTHVVFTNGDMDPWHRLGVLEDLSETVLAKVTYETTHCEILSEVKGELRALTEDREYVKNLIMKWIA